MGKKVKELRRLNQWSLRELESRTGITASYIYRIENGGNSNPTVNVLKKLSEAFNVCPLVFFNEVEIEDEELEIFELKEMNGNSMFTSKH